MRSRLIWVLALGLLASVAARATVAGASVCASVKLQIQQSATLERQAFDAHLGITNGRPGIDVANVDVDLVVTDQQGNPVVVSFDPYDPNASSVKFFARVDRMENISDVSGAGVVAGGTVADVHWLLIPTVGAADGLAAGKSYLVGATLSYTLAGEPFTMNIEPDAILVKPLPELSVDYFFPADVYADDPFTPQDIEPAIPFSIGQRVANNGVGTARSVAIESSQIRILENTQDLLVAFRLEGTEVNGVASANTLQASLGDIAPGAAAIARWVMTTTLSGRFTVFSAAFTHADELGGAVTSVVAGSGVHSLVHDVLADGPGKDAIRDFLAADAGSYVLYESENVNTPVADLHASSTLVFAGSSGGETTYTLTTPTTIGCGYVKLDDPHGGLKVVKQARRSDGKVIGADNVWLSKTYDKVGGQWTYFFNLFDADSPGSYTVVFANAPAEPHAPVLQLIADKIVVEGSPLSFAAVATDADGTTPALSAAPLLAGAAFVDGGAGGGTFSWTPAVGQAGSYTLTVTATDGALSDSQDVRITVRSILDTDGDGMPDAWETLHFATLARDGSGDYDGDGVSDLAEYLAGTDPSNRAPVLVAIGAKTVAENSLLAFAVSASDPDGTTPAVTASGLPAGASFDGAAFAWTPNFDQSGTYAVTFVASDGERTASEEVQITVTNLNRAPTVPRIAAPENQSEVQAARPAFVLENSTDADGDALAYEFEIYADAELTMLTASSGSVAEQADFTSWTPQVDLADNAWHHWRARARDSAGAGAAFSDWAYARVFVNRANEAPGGFAVSSPAAGADVASRTPELRVTNSADPDGDVVTYSFFVYRDGTPPVLVDSATSIAAGAGGSTAWTVTATLQDNAWHSWTATATDEHGLSTQLGPSAFFVNTVNDPPTTPLVSAPADGAEVATGTVSLTVVNATDSDGTVPTYTFERDTVNTFDGPGKVVSGPVAQGATTTSWETFGLVENTRYYWRCRAEDAWVGSSWAEASFFVNAVNEAPSAPTPRSPGAGARVASATLRLDVFAATDPDQDALTYAYEVYAQPSGTLVASATGQGTEWVVAPQLAMYASYTWRAQATDADGLAGPWSAPTPFFTDDNGIDDPPTITVTEPASAVVQSGGSYTIRWTDADPDSNATIRLFRDSDGLGTNRTEIVSGLSEDLDGPAGSYVWDLSGVPDGTWYISAEISDGTSSWTDYAPGTVTVGSGLPQPVAVLNPWTNLHSSAPGTTSKTNLAVGSFAVGSGQSRLLLVSVVVETGRASNPTISAAYGGTQLALVKKTATSQRGAVWMGSLTDAQIGSGTKALTVTYSGATGNATGLHVKWSAYTGADQGQPVASSGATNTNTTSATFGSTISYVKNGLTVVAAGNGGTATAALSTTPAFTPGALENSSGQSSQSFATAVHAAAGTYPGTTAVQWSGSPASYSGLVVASIRPVTPNGPPAFAVNPIVKPDAVVGQPYTGQTLAGSAADPDGDAITYSKPDTSGWLAVAGDGTLSGTPLVAGNYSFTVRATSTGGYADATLNIAVVPAPAGVSVLDPWTNSHSSAPNTPSATNLNAGSFTVSGGANRLLLVAVVMEIGTASNPSIGASYGGTALTPIAVTANTQREVAWLGYLKDTQIGSGSKTLTVTYSGASGNATGLHVKWSSYSGVGQASPLAGFAASNTSKTWATFGSTVSYVAGGLTTAVAGNGGTPATATLAATPALPAGGVVQSDGHSSQVFTSATHAAAGTYSAATTVQWSGTTKTYSGIAVVSLRP